MSHRKLLDDEEDQFETYLCCFKVKKMKQKSVADKLSMQFHRISQYETPTLVPEPQPRLINSLTDSQFRAMDYPKEKVFLLKNKVLKEQMLVKITEKHFNQNELTLSQNREEFSPRTESADLSTPIFVAKYIAKRISRRAHIVTDLGCGNGGNTIQFAKECDFVIAVDIDRQACEKTQKICKNQKVSQKVDIINADLFLLNRIQTDAFFVNPTVRVEEGAQCYDINKYCSPDLSQLLKLKQSKTINFAIQLPGFVEIQSLLGIINLTQKTWLCMEVEQIYVNNKLDHQVLYLGDLASVKQNEILKFLFKHLKQVSKQSLEKAQIVPILERMMNFITLPVLIDRVLDGVKQKQTFDQFCKVIESKYGLQEEMNSIMNKQTNTNDDYSMFQKKDSLFMLSKPENDELQSPVMESITYDHSHWQPSLPNYFDQLHQINPDEQPKEDENCQFAMEMKHD